MGGDAVESDTGRKSGEHQTEVLAGLVDIALQRLAMMPSGEIVVRLGKSALADSGLDEKAHPAPASARNKRLRISVSIFGIALPRHGTNRSFLLSLASQLLVLTFV